MHSHKERHEASESSIKPAQLRHLWLQRWLGAIHGRCPSIRLLEVLADPLVLRPAALVLLSLPLHEGVPILRDDPLPAS
jgi:hypothetical protein